jgi:hypothetical protein
MLSTLYFRNFSAIIVMVHHKFQYLLIKLIIVLFSAFLDILKAFIGLTPGYSNYESIFLRNIDILQTFILSQLY